MPLRKVCVDNRNLKLTVVLVIPMRQLSGCHVCSLAAALKGEKLEAEVEALQTTRDKKIWSASRPSILTMTQLGSPGARRCLVFQN